MCGSVRQKCASGVRQDHNPSRNLLIEDDTLPRYFHFNPRFIWTLLPRYTYLIIRDKPVSIEKPQKFKIFLGLLDDADNRGRSVLRQLG